MAKNVKHGSCNVQCVALTIDIPQDGILRLILTDGQGRELRREDVPCLGHVDNLLLTAVDNLLRRSNLHKSALSEVVVGQGIDKKSSLYRIVTSFSSAILVAKKARNSVESAV